MLEMQRQTRSCFCYSPAHGAAIIGVSFFIGSTVVALMLVGLVAEWAEVLQNIERNSGGDTSGDYALLHLIIIVKLNLALFLMVFSVWMLFGIKKSRKLYLLPWLVWSTGSLLFYSVASVYSATVTASGVRWREAALISGFVAVALVWAYAIYCVLGFYQLLSAQEDKLEIEAGESERASRSKWYSLRRPKLPRSIWEWNRNTDDEDDERASRRGIIE